MTPHLRHETFEVAVAAGLDEVWRLLTTADGLSSWFGTEASIDLRVGGASRVAWGAGVAIDAEVTAVEQHDRLRLAYLHEGQEMGAEEWLLSHEAGTTTVRLVHSMPDDGIEDWDSFYGDMRRGWRIFLTSLRLALEVTATPARVAEPRHVPARGTRPAVWETVMAAFGLGEVTEGAVVDGDGAVSGMTAVIVDPPHSLLLASRDATLVCDVEGAPPQQMLYVQAATHGDGARAGWRATVLATAEAALSTADAHPADARPADARPAGAN